MVKVVALMHDTEGARADLSIQVDFYLTEWYLPCVERVASARLVLREIKKN